MSEKGGKHMAQTKAHNSRQPTAAGAHLPESTALRSDKGLDVLNSTPARFVFRAPSISGHLRALASRPGKKCGLEVTGTIRSCALVLPGSPLGLQSGVAYSDPMSIAV